MTNDHMIMRATAIVNDLTKITDPAGGLDVLTFAIYLVVVMTSEEEEEADEMTRAVVDVMAKRMVNFERDRETFKKTRKGKGKDAIAALMGMKP